MSRPDKTDALEGVWEMVRAELGGAAAPDVVVQNTTIELAQGEYRVRFRDEVMDRGSFELSDDPQAPLVLRGSVGPNSGRIIPCRYQLTGNRLRICYGLDGTTPAEFRTTEGRSRYLATYRRKSGHS